MLAKEVMAVRSITLYAGDKSLKNLLTNSSCQKSYLWLQFGCGFRCSSAI